MLNAARHRMHKDEEEGFTLIELLVVVLILGILMAIAIPTFLSLTGNAKTNAAESDLTTAAQDEATLFTQNGTYGTSAATNLTDTSVTPTTGVTTIDPGLNWTSTTAVPAATTAGTKTVNVLWVSATEIALQTAGSNGSYYYMDVKSGKLSYDVGTATTTMPTSAAAVTWGTSWKGATTL